MTPVPPQASGITRGGVARLPPLPPHPYVNTHPHLPRHSLCMAVKKSELYSLALEELRRAPRRHGRLAVQGLRPHAAVRQVRLRQVRRRAPRPHRRARGGSFDDMVAAQGRQGDRRQDQQDHRPARRGATSSRASSTSPTSTTRPSSGAGKEMVDRLSNLVGIFQGLDLRAQPGRRRRPPRRRLRVPHAALRHGVGQEQGAVLHARRGVPHHGEGDRHRPATPRRTQTVYDPTAARARSC